MKDVVNGFAQSMRRAVSVMAIAVIAGLLPMAANFGLCATKPCCRSHSAASVPAMASHPACCNETNCEVAKGDTEATAHAKNPISNLRLLIAAPESLLVLVPPATSILWRFSSPSPPTQRRLASLSILII